MKNGLIWTKKTCRILGERFRRLLNINELAIKKVGWGTFVFSTYFSILIIYLFLEHLVGILSILVELGKFCYYSRTVFRICYAKPF